MPDACISPSDRRIQNLARILQAILEGNAYYLQAACKILARFESSCKNLARFWIQLASILQDYEFILQVSCKILNSSIFFYLVRWLHSAVDGAEIVKLLSENLIQSS